MSASTFLPVSTQRDLLSAVFPFEVVVNPLINFSVGAELEPVENLILRAGAYTNFRPASAIPEIPTKAYQPDVDLFGVTSSLGYKSGEQN